MRRTDGAEVCRALRRVFPPPFPIIAATANAKDPQTLMASAGFSAVLEKPFPAIRLRETLEVTVGLARAAAAGGGVGGVVGEDSASLTTASSSNTTATSSSSSTSSASSAGTRCSGGGGDRGSGSR